jgi:alginate O-acetyltransferase complex protein AlgI
MYFSSVTFLFLFLPLTCLGYFLTPKGYRNYTLLVANLLFYIWIEPIFFFLLLFIILVDYFSGLSIEKWRHKKRVCKGVILFSVLTNAAVLLMFKYVLLFPNFVPMVFQEETPILEFMIPLGISIYTLQGLSYLLDLYWNKIKVQKNFVNLAMYISFFPQLVAGPIIRYTDISRDLTTRTVNATKISKGYGFFIRGLAKKVLLSDVLLSTWSSISSNEIAQLSVGSAWIGILCFSFGIYLYFSGYSDMARGIAKMLGFEIPNNFNYPYVAKSATEFWRRWNISLTVWFKTYIFSKIAPHSSSFMLAVAKLMGIWACIGLWYGKEANFLLWGIYFGMIILMEQLFLSPFLEKLPKLLQRCYTFFVVIFGWVIFQMETLEQILGYCHALFFAVPWDDAAGYYLSICWFPLLLAYFASKNLPHRIAGNLENKYPRLSLWTNVGWELLLTLLCLIWVSSGIPSDTLTLIRL